MTVVRGAGILASGLVATFCWLAAPALAQPVEQWTVEAHGSAFMSPYATMEQGAAFGGRLLIAPDAPRWLRIGVSGIQLVSRSERDGKVCIRLDPIPQICHPERVEDRVSLRSYGVGAFPEVDLSWTVRARGGLGITISELHARSRGVESGGLGNLYVVPWGHMGAFAEAGLLWTPFDHLPLDAVVSTNVNVVWFDSCHNHPDMFNPLCGLSHITELRLGVSYRVNM